MEFLVALSDVPSCIGLSVRASCRTGPPVGLCAKGLPDFETTKRSHQRSLMFLTANFLEVS
jgi:hypothetical protein